MSSGSPATVLRQQRSCYRSTHPSPSEQGSHLHVVARAIPTRDLHEDEPQRRIRCQCHKRQAPTSLRTSTSAQIAQTAERQLCSRRRLTGDADAAARTAPVGRDGMCTPASRLGPQGGSGRGEQAKVTFGPVLSYPDGCVSAGHKPPARSVVMLAVLCPC